MPARASFLVTVASSPATMSARCSEIRRNALSIGSRLRIRFRTCSHRVTGESSPRRIRSASALAVSRCRSGTLLTRAGCCSSWLLLFSCFSLTTKVTTLRRNNRTKTPCSRPPADYGVDQHDNEHNECDIKQHQHICEDRRHQFGNPSPTPVCRHRMFHLPVTSRAI